MIGLLNQRSGDQGALTRFTWSYALYLLPYAVLAAPLLQMIFPRLAAAAESGPEAVRGTLAETGPVVVAAAWLGAGLLVATAVPVARVFVLGPGSGRTAALAWPIAAFAPAVVGFSLLGLASRTLLARHRGARGRSGHGGRPGLVVIVGVRARRGRWCRRPGWYRRSPRRSRSAWSSAAGSAGCWSGATRPAEPASG